MNNFMKGVLVGVGIGLLVAPMRGEETRRLLAQRFEELRARIPENSQIGGYVQQVSGRVSQTASNLKGYAQEAASRVKDTASDLTDISEARGKGHGGRRSRPSQPSSAALAPHIIDGRSSKLVKSKRSA